MDLTTIIIGFATGAFTVLLAWVNKTFNSYISERDKFRDEIINLKASNLSLVAQNTLRDTTVAGLQMKVQSQALVSEQQQATIQEQAATIRELKAALIEKQTENQDLLDRIIRLEEIIAALKLERDDALQDIGKES